jgi:glycosyltransferase involved in cell wall biosynthesis
MRYEPRVAFFTDSYLEVNGVANTSRQFAAFAQRRNLPMLVAHAGPRTEAAEDGGVQCLSLKRSSFGFAIDSDLRFDLLMMRHARFAVETTREFKADLVHITGPSDVGLLGVYVARKLKLPLVISWHTNLHEYAGRRLRKSDRLLPTRLQNLAAAFAERQSLRMLTNFYKLGRALLAPNEELGETLERDCRRPVFMMRRGVDTELFSPLKRLRADSTLVIGYVGRLTPEKSVRELASLEKSLTEAGLSDFKFVIVGAGSERGWLEANMRHCEFTGVLSGEPLARVYANFDLFVFPSETDTFGNVVLEAQASGVPAIVSAQGGPKHIIHRAGRNATGVVAANAREFAEAILELKSQPELRSRMGEAARRLALAASWDNVFDQVYRAYSVCLQNAEKERQLVPSLTITSSDVVQ